MQSTPEDGWKDDMAISSRRESTEIENLSPGVTKITFRGGLLPSLSRSWLIDGNMGKNREQYSSGGVAVKLARA